MSDKIEKAEQMKNEFIASISHEIRTPLTGIKGWSETLKTVEHLTEEEIKQGMGIISGETDRLIHLVEELLDFQDYNQIILIYINKRCNCTIY